MFTTTVTCLSFTDAKVEVIGNANTLAEADAEAAAKVGVMVVKQILKVQRSIPGDVADFTPFSTAATKQYENFRLKVTKPNPDVPGNTLTRDIDVNDAALDFKLTGSRRVNTSLAPITNIATTYRDGRGEGGYTVSEGTYAK